MVWDSLRARMLKNSELGGNPEAWKRVFKWAYIDSKKEEEKEEKEEGKAPKKA